MKQDFLFDRSAVKRRDADWLAEQLTQPESRFLPCWRLQNFFAGEESPLPVSLAAVDLEDLLDSSKVIFLGTREKNPWFALVLPDDQSVADRLRPFGVFCRLRRLVSVVPDSVFLMLSYVRAMAYWHRRNRYCGDCGALNAGAEGGHLLVCTNPACQRQHFPRTDPAVIVQVSWQDRCLLARQAGWPAGLYSVLAGFVEPGESLEEAVAREVREESGVEVQQIDYVGSQPWAFPRSLMVGFTAVATSGEIACADGELEDVRWVARSELKKELEQGTIRVPTPGALAHRLIAGWFAAGGEEKSLAALRSP
ncbi:MAG: NAD(+) diphosphatase [Deltaproteobacteria bacterium]|nr:NAD(+) diphosphatase [Candidatus Anaeroferrophillus wilburensis]MBN2887786.1 NAD(+) diphosphatase [Deltaproteobacteria bacterium]